MAKSFANVIRPAVKRAQRPSLLKPAAASKRPAARWKRVKTSHTVLLEAKRGKERELADFLRGCLQFTHQEPFTAAWYAIRLGPSRFVIFAAFGDDNDRRAHLAGRMFAALAQRSAELLARPPAIDRAEVLAAKLAGFG
jgi:quinol monooxygenase YgiN